MLRTPRRKKSPINILWVIINLPKSVAYIFNSDAYEKVNSLMIIKQKLKKVSKMDVSIIFSMANNTASSQIAEDAYTIVS